MERRLAARAAKARAVRVGRVRSVVVEKRVAGLCARELVEGVGEAEELIVTKARRSRVAAG